ncbi:MAG TPA: cache domain-containing protein [Anaeromyxobacter sp.]
MSDRLRHSIRLKLIGALVVGLALISGATAVLMNFVHERATGVAAQREVAAAADALAELEALEIERMSALLEVILANDRLAARLAARDRAGLLALAAPIFEALQAQHGLTHWYFHLPDPVNDGVFLRVHRPALHGDPVRRPVVRRAVAEGRQASGRELGRTAFAVRVVRPWVAGDRLLGFVELGEDIPTFLRRIKAMTGDELGMLLAKSRLDRDAWSTVTGPQDRWESRPDLVAVETTTGDEALLGTVGRLSDIPDAPTVLGQARHGARSVVRGVFPLRDEEGEKIGAVVVVHDVTALRDGVRELRGRVVMLVGLLAVALGALLVFLLETLVFERLERMSRVLEDLPDRLARGDYTLEEDGPARDDEIGRFERFFRRALREVGSFVSDVRRDRSRPVPRRPRE